MCQLVSNRLCFSISGILLLGVLFALTACDRASQWEKESADLQRQMLDLERRQHSLQTSIDSLWDATTNQLADALPDGFPPVDRDIFLNARNADHIRMFMSFEKLDAHAQMLVNKAGEQDEILAAKARKLMEQQQAFEQRKIGFLKKVEQQDPAAGQLYASKFRSATKVDKG